MTILVTGATGNIGRCVVDRLVGAGQRVRAMSRDPRNVRFGVHGDFEKPDSWAEALASVRRVYLFSYATEEFVEEAIKAGVRRFVVHSAAAAGFGPDEGTPGPLRDHLADERVGHRNIEEWVEKSGAEWTHVRPGLLAANALGWAETIRTTHTVKEPYADAGYPWVHERDVAEIAVAALLTDDHLGAAYTLTGPAKVTQKDQVEAISKAIGREIDFEEVTPEEGRARWVRDGLPADYADWLVELLAVSVDGPGSLPPTDTYERITGRPPRTFAQWAKDHVEDFSS